MALSDRNDHSEDMFADTRMTFGEHLEDLRTHLLRALGGFLVALFFSFFIGKPVLQIIAAPVEQQLGEFYRNRAREVLKDADKDPRLKEANRPRFVKMAFHRNQLEAALKGRSPSEDLQALPEQVRPMPYADLVSRAQIELSVAEEALREVDWDKLQEAAAGLEQTATYLGQADKVPEGEKDNQPQLAAKLGEEAAALRDAAGRQKPERSEEILQRISDLLADRELIPFWVRIEEPVRFFASLYNASSQVARRPALSTLSVQEAFMAYFKVCIACGIVLGSPWIFYQLWSFVAAGLYPHEKYYVHMYLPVSLGLFIAGVVMCQIFVIPKAIEALLWFNQWVGLEPDIRFNEWLGFAIMMPLVFGISFQLPLVMMFLERIGIFDVQTYLSKWRIALFVIHVFAAIITPSVDIFSMELLALPMFGLYGLGILFCKLNRRPKDLDVDVPESEEMVEV